jgi:hypothetical protein
VDGWLILKWILRKCGVMVSSGLGQSSLVGCYNLLSVKSWEFINQLIDYQFYKKDSAAWSCLLVGACYNIA